jgi:hypothetical protein
MLMLFQQRFIKVLVETTQHHRKSRCFFERSPPKTEDSCGEEFNACCYFPAKTAKTA